MGISEEEIAVCEALRTLAGETAEITDKETLGADMVGLIEKKLGAGPWQMSVVEQLMHDKDMMCTSENATNSPAVEASASAVGTNSSNPPEADTLFDETSEESRGPSEWRTKELTCLHSMLNEVLKKTENEEDVNSTEFLIAEDAEFDAMKIQRGIMHHVVTPLRGSPLHPVGGAEVLWKARMQQLPRVVEELSSLLQKSLRLTRYYGMQHEQQRSFLQTAKEMADLERQRRMEAETQARHDESVQTMLEATIQRLSSARQSVQEKEEELVKLRQHVDLLFSERARQDEVVEELEAKVQQFEIQRNAETHVGCESSETELRSVADLRRRLSAAELALDDAKEVSARKDRHIAELETQLRQLQQCMQRSVPDAAVESMGGTHTPREDNSAVCDSLVKVRRSPPGLPGTAVNALKLEKPASGLEKPSMVSTTNPNQAQFFNMAAADAEEETEAAARRSKKKRDRAGRNSHGAGAMPGDLKTLGRMLSFDSTGNLLDGIFSMKSSKLQR
eukprot:gnl/MRDRNA2_/MRDRNA2_76750_c0_seq1.p1 gnl/MRDRNA2_/MRDRNA2_76750_c0~~gnl/MRDRNA2_/MRDRNA2_76750_c0_seq1.p1  ORF type:complete len:506 (-),score=127.80 gnl/MRDRNA2_/MRDRNA2_76750_c0_seq1:22-1539(-)